MEKSSYVPVIGISPQIDVTSPFRTLRLFPQYQRALEECGALGLMLPMSADEATTGRMIELCDGFILTGGQDLDPALYGEAPTTTNETAPERDAYEPAVFPEIMASGKPVLAICRGMQMLNVLHGGTIRQDLPYQGRSSEEMTRIAGEFAKERGIELGPGKNQNALMEEILRAYPPEEGDVLHPDWMRSTSRVHAVNLEEGSRIREIAGADQIFVNSLHHQGLGKIGEGIRPTGICDDGLVEAFELDRDSFFIGVQWHPEVLFCAEDAFSRKLFTAFVDACREKSL